MGKLLVVLPQESQTSFAIHAVHMLLSTITMIILVTILITIIIIITMIIIIVTILIIIGIIIIITSKGSHSTYAINVQLFPTDSMLC